MATEKMKLVNALKFGGLGVILGAGLDQLTFVLDGYYPMLAKPSGFRVPLYDQTMGIHYDDILVQAINFGTIGYGIYKKNPKLIATGIGMVIGAILSSRVQGNPVRPFQLNSNDVKVKQFENDSGFDTGGDFSAEAVRQTNQVTTTGIKYPDLHYSY